MIRSIIHNIDSFVVASSTEQTPTDVCFEEGRRSTVSFGISVDNILNVVVL